MVRFVFLLQVFIAGGALAAAASPQDCAKPATSAAGSPTAPVARAPSPADLPTPSDPTEILRVAALVNGLNAEGLTPWHIKATYQLYDDKGKATEKGTYEESWVNPHKYRRIYTRPSFQATEWATADGKYYRKGNASGAPFLDRLMRRELLSPIPDQRSIAEAKPEIREQEFGKVKLRCVMLGQPMKETKIIPLGLFPTYCFGLALPVLRSTGFFGGTSAVRNQVRLFQKHFMPLDIHIADQGKSLIDVHVDVLEGLRVIDEPDFHPPADAEESTKKTISISSSAAGGRVLNRIEPVYPPAAKEHGVQGKVILHATIGTDGHIRDIRILSAPDASLAISAVAALLRTAYEPYRLNGEPVEIETTVNITYKLSY